MVKVAIIGVSGYAKDYLSILIPLVERGDVALCSAVVRDPVKDARICEILAGLGCAIYQNHHDLVGSMAGKADLCIIPTPPYTHCEMVVAALKAKFHVLVEKPLAVETSEIRTLELNAAKADRFVAVGFQDMYVNETHDIKRLILNGAIGFPRKVEVFCMAPRPTAYFKRNGWAGKLTLEGRIVRDSPISNAFAHMINLALFWVGSEPATSATLTSVSGSVYRAQNIESYDTATVRLATESKAVVNVFQSHSGMRYSPARILITGEEGTLEWLQERSYSFGNKESMKTYTFPRSNIARESMLRNVLGRVAGNDTYYCPISVASAHTTAVEKIAREIRIVDINKKYVRAVNINGAVHETIVGLEEAMELAAKQTKNLDEVAPWLVGS